MLLLGRRVIRFVPQGAKTALFTALAQEMELVTTTSGPASMWRLSAFCRIILQPVGRGGRRHCKQTVAVVAGRLARWAAGQLGSLVREYLGDSGTTRGPRGPKSGQVGSSLSDLLPDGTRRAALRAVQHMAPGKVALILAQEEHSS